jgi:hypothetical protein
VQTRHFEDLKDKRLLNRGNSIFNRLFANSIYSMRQLASSDSETIIKKMSSNCVSCVGGKSVLCIQDTSEINLYNHRNRIKKDDYIGVNGNVGSLGFVIHPSFVLDSETLMAYGFSDVKVWNRSVEEPHKGRTHQKKSSQLKRKNRING